MSHLLTSLTILLSVLVLVGWAFDIKVLSQPIPKAAAMNPFTALCFILLSISLILLRSFGRIGSINFLGIILASVVLILAMVVLGQLIFESNIRIDAWLFYSKMDTGVEGKSINFMASNTAICFILTSVALLILNKPSRFKWIPSEFLALFVGFVAMTTLIGYLYSVEAFYTIFKFFPMAIYTAISFLLITLAILFSNKNKGFISKFSGSMIGSSISGKLLPVAIILPILLGFIRLFLGHNGFVSDELGVGLLVLCNMGIFILIIWIYALELNKKDVLRKSAELITIETSNRLRLATQAGNVGIWELDVVDNKLLWDKQMCALYGLTADTFSGDYKEWIKTIHPEDAERSRNEVQASIHEGKGYSSEYRVIWPGASIKTIKANAKIERNKAGNALRFIGVNWDISDLKMAEEILQNTIEIVSNYKYALDESAIVAFTDHKGIIDQVNDNFCEISQYSREELIGQDYRLLNAGYHTTAFMRNLWETISQGNVWKGEIKNKAKDGKFYWVNTTIVPFLNKKGTPYRYMAIRADITKQKRLQEEVKQINLESAQKAKDRIEELAAKEEHLNSIFNTVADIIFALDVEKDGRYRFNSVNPTFLKKTGLDYNQVIGKTLHDVIPKESMPFLLKKYEEIIRTKKIVRWEQAIDFPNGKLIGDMSIAPIFDITGNCTKVIGSVHDLTQRIIGENRLKISENRFRNLFENAPDSIVVLDLKSEKFVKINKNASKMFKFSAKKLAELGPVDISPEFQPDGTLSAEKAKGYIEKSMLGKKVTFEWVHCDANKKEIECKILLALLPGTDSPQIYANIIDITERNETQKKIKQQLKEPVFQNEEKEKRAAELIIANKELLFQNEEKGKRAAELIIANKELLFQDEEKEKRAAELIIANKELLFQNEEKGKRAAELIIAITELKKTKSELDRFVYSASHDLRSPLKSLLGLSDMIIDDISTDNILQLKQMDMMKSSIIKLDNFIEDILNYSRNARTEVANEAIDFRQTIDDITNNLIHMDGAKEIKLKMEMDQDLKFVSDRARVNLILNNLISNALKYKDPSKKHQFLGIQIKNSNDNAVITIEDNGIGIEAKNKEKIFDMFYRATKTSTGSGLGLYIVKEAINKLAGSIKMESELTKGTKFIVTIPNYC